MLTLCTMPKSKSDKLVHLVMDSTGLNSVSGRARTELQIIRATTLLIVQSCALTAAMIAGGISPFHLLFYSLANANG